MHFLLATHLCYFWQTSHLARLHIGYVFSFFFIPLVSYTFELLQANIYNKSKNKPIQRVLFFKSSSQNIPICFLLYKTHDMRFYAIYII